MVRQRGAGMHCVNKKVSVLNSQNHHEKESQKQEDAALLLVM